MQVFCITLFLFESKCYLCCASLQVVGIDFSERYIAAAEQLKKDGFLSYCPSKELNQPPPTKLDKPDDARVYTDIDVNKVTFKQV